MGIDFESSGYWAVPLFSPCRLNPNPATYRMRLLMPGIALPAMVRLSIIQRNLSWGPPQVIRSLLAGFDTGIVWSHSGHCRGLTSYLYSPLV